MSGQGTREETLRAALREAVLGSAPPARALAPGEDRDRSSRRWVAKVARAEGVEFVRGIIDTAALIQGAHHTSGEPVFRTDARYKLLAALDRIGGWPSIAEIARVLRVSKQAAREQVIAAARTGELSLLAMLLGGLDARDMRLVAHVLRVMRERLLRAERERTHVERERLHLRERTSRRRKSRG
jgi:hypothetical protein